MAATPLVSTKKCPFCQQWSEWELRPTDRCTHCGHLLDPQAHQRAEADAVAAAQPPKSALRLIEIRPEDGPVLTFFKWLGRGGQLLFIALLSFFVWVATAIAA